MNNLQMNEVEAKRLEINHFTKSSSPINGKKIKKTEKNNSNNPKGKGFSKKGLPKGNLRVTDIVLLLYDIGAVNLSFFLALWFRFDCQYGKNFASLPQR